MSLLISLLGAESTGKTDLAHALVRRLERSGWLAPGGALVVEEVLREFCDRHGRTPRREEQAAIAAEQTRRIRAAMARADVVVADTTALMTAVYSDFVFADRSLYAPAAMDHRDSALTLVTALDLPWQPDGLQRDGPHVRAPVDALLREALAVHGFSYGVVAGQGEARVEAAWLAVARLVRPPAAPREPNGRDAPKRWSRLCERCGDPDCERDSHPVLGGRDDRR
jgi:nicotinamide riboside kinase